MIGLIEIVLYICACQLTYVKSKDEEISLVLGRLIDIDLKFDFLVLGIKVSEAKLRTLSNETCHIRYLCFEIKNDIVKLNGYSTPKIKYITATDGKLTKTYFFIYNRAQLYQYLKVGEKFIKEYEVPFDIANIRGTIRHINFPCNDDIFCIRYKSNGSKKIIVNGQFPPDSHSITLFPSWNSSTYKPYTILFISYETQAAVIYGGIGTEVNYKKRYYEPIKELRAENAFKLEYKMPCPKGEICYKITDQYTVSYSGVIPKEQALFAIYNENNKIFPYDYDIFKRRTDMYQYKIALGAYLNENIIMNDIVESVISEEIIFNTSNCTNEGFCYKLLKDGKGINIYGKRPINLSYLTILTKKHNTIRSISYQFFLIDETYSVSYANNEDILIDIDTDNFVQSISSNIPIMEHPQQCANKCDCIMYSGGNRQFRFEGRMNDKIEFITLFKDANWKIPLLTLKFIQMEPILTKVSIQKECANNQYIATPINKLIPIVGNFKQFKKYIDKASSTSENSDKHIESNIGKDSSSSEYPDTLLEEIDKTNKDCKLNYPFYIDVTFNALYRVTDHSPGTILHTKDCPEGELCFVEIGCMNEIHLFGLVKDGKNIFTLFSGFETMKFCIENTYKVKYFEDAD